MNVFGSDGESASGMNRIPVYPDADGKRRKARDGDAEMTRQKSHRSSRGKRDHQRQGKLLKDERCPEDSHSVLAEKPNKNQIKANVGELKHSSRQGCVGSKGNDISGKSNLLNMLFSWIRKRRKSKKGDLSETDLTKKAELEKRWSAFSLEDKYYVKSQLSIWFPCIFRHPTLSELEAALAHMGTRILDKVSMFQIIELNPNLTLSRSARNHFRIHHHKYRMNDLDDELMGALICQQKSPTRSSVAFGSIRFPPEDADGSLRSGKMLSQLTMIASKIDGLATKTSNNSFLNAERNWRHNAMAGSADSPAAVSPAHSCGDMTEFGASQLEEMYNRKKYHVPDWFYLLAQNGLAIELLPANMDDFEIDSKEVKKIVESSRRIFLSIVPNCDEHGHIFVSIAEQERGCPVRSLPGKMPPLRENRQKDTSKLSLIPVVPTPPSCDDSVHTTESGSGNDQSWEELFPLDRVLSFRHNWSLVNNAMTGKPRSIPRQKGKGPRKFPGSPKSGPDLNPDNINFSSATRSQQQLEGNFAKRLAPDDGKENVNSANVGKCRQHKQMISRILKLMKERTHADESSRGGDKRRDILKSPDTRVASEAIVDNSFITETQYCPRRQRSTLTKCHKNVRFADVNRLRDGVASPCIGARPEVNKSNSAIDDIDVLAEAKKKFFQKAEKILDKNYSSLLRSEYFVPVRSRNYDVDYFTRSVKVHKACQVDQRHEAGEEYFRCRADSDVTKWQRCFRPDACYMGSPSSKTSDCTNFVLGEDLSKLTKNKNGNEARARREAKTYNWSSSDHVDQQNMRDCNDEARKAFSGIPIAVQVPSSSTIEESDFAAKKVNLCGQQAMRKYPLGTFAKFVNEHLHSDSRTELRGTKSGSGHCELHGAKSGSGHCELHGVKSGSGHCELHGVKSGYGHCELHGTKSGSGHCELHGAKSGSGHCELHGTKSGSGHCELHGTKSESGQCELHGTKSESGHCELHGAKSGSGHCELHGVKSESGHSELQGVKSGSGHKRQPKMSSSEAEETNQHAQRLSPTSREKRRRCPKTRPDGRKTNETREITEQDYEIACANRRLGYNYICTFVDDYYKSFLSCEDKPAGAARIPYQGPETSRHGDVKSNRGHTCFHHNTGGSRDMVVKSKATPEDNRSLTRLIDRYLNSGDKKVVDITKPLRDLDALLEYCSKMTSADCLLGDSTLGILRAINDVITRFITSEDDKLAARVKGGNATFKESRGSGPLQKLCRPYNVTRCKVLIDVATQTHLKAINLYGESECCRCTRPKYPPQHLVEDEHRKVPFRERSCETRDSSGGAFRPLDETQNKLDSDVDDQAACRIRTSDEPVGKHVSSTMTENGPSKGYGRPWGKELDRRFALPQKPSADATSVYSDALVDPASKSDTAQSRTSPERPAPAFFSSQKLASVVTLGGASSCSVTKDRVTFQRTRKEPTPLEIIITPASPPNSSDNHGSLASNDNGKSSPNGTDDVLYRHYLGVIHGTDTLRPPSTFPQAAQEHAFRYGEPRRPSYYDGAISQNLRPEQSGRTSDETYGLPARESTGIRTSKIISMESTFNPNGSSSFDRSPKQTDSFATHVSNPNTSCNKVDCPTRVCAGQCVSQVCTGECVSRVCTGGCLTQTCPVKCISHPYTSSCSPCASALPRNLECHCKPEVTLRSCMTPAPWRHRYRLCKNSLDDNLGSYLCHQNRVSDLPSSFLNIRPSLNVTPHARGCHRTINDIFCDLGRECTSPDCFSDYRRRPAHDCLNFFERKLTDKLPSYSTRNSRYPNMPSFESVPEGLRRLPFQRSEPPFKVADPNAVSDIQQQTLALIGQVLNTLQANSKPPDATAAQKLKASPSSDLESCSKPFKERRCLAAQRKKCKKIKPECPCKNREEDPPSEQSSQRVHADVKPMNFEIDFMDEISEQSLPRTRMCTKSLQVNMDACVRQPPQASPVHRAPVRNVGMASVQTCACISKPTGECQCGCLSEKLVIPQRKCPCADQLVVDVPVETSVCPCAFKKHACSVNRCPKPVTSSCGQKCLECSENKSVQTSIACQKSSCNKKCQIGKLNPVACVSTDVCGSRQLNEPSLGACGKNSPKRSWNQPLKQSRSSEVCGDSDVSDCTSTVHRFPAGQRSTTGHGSCQRKSPRINFHFPSHKFCDKLRSCLQNPCDNIPLRQSKYETGMSPCFPMPSDDRNTYQEDRNTYQETYSRSTTPCRQRRSERASRSFQSLFDSNYMPVRSSVTNRNSRMEPLCTVPECGCDQEKSNQLRSCKSCTTRRDSSPWTFSETAPEANNVRKTAWCECSAPKGDANDTIKEAVSADAQKPTDREAEKSRPFVHIKYKSKKIVSDKAGEVRQEQAACSAYGVKGLAEQLKEQIDEIISRSRDLQQQAIQFNTGSPRFCVDSMAENRPTGCDGRLPSADNCVPPSDNRFTFSDNRVSATGNRFTASDNRYSTSDNRYSASNNRFSSSDNRYSTPEIRFTGCDNNATGSVNRVTVASYDARAQNIPASPGSEARPSSVVGADLRVSNTLTSPRSDVKVRNSHFSTGGHPGNKSSGLVAPHNSVVEGAEDETPRSSQARSRDLSVLGDLKMASGTGVSLAMDGSCRPVEGESTVIDMESRGSQDVIRFQTQREGSEGWSFYEVEVNDPKAPTDVKKSEGSPNKNSNSNKTGNKVENERIKHLGKYELKPKLCASNNLNLFPDASKADKMAYKFPAPMSCAMKKVCPACKKSYTIVPGFRPVVLGHCTNLNVSWNASSGEETHNTGQVTRDVFGQPHEAARTPPSFVETRAPDYLNHVSSKPPARECSRKHYRGRTVYFTPERTQEVESGAKNLKHDGASAIVKDGNSGCGAYGDGRISKLVINSHCNIDLNANGDTAPRTVRRRSFKEAVVNFANQNGPSRSQRRLKNAPILQNRNINSVEYHEISCEDPVSSSYGHQFDTYFNNGNRATKNDQSMVRVPKHVGTLRTAAEEMVSSQGDHGSRDQIVPTIRQVVAASNNESRHFHTNAQHVSNKMLRKAHTPIAAARRGVTRGMDDGVTTQSQLRPRKTTIIEDFSDARSTPECSTSYKRQHQPHDVRKHKASHFTSDKTNGYFNIMLKTGTPACTMPSLDSKPLLKSCRTRARLQDRLYPQCVNVETVPIKQDRTQTNSGVTNSVLENDVLLGQQRAKRNHNHPGVVEEKGNKFVVEDNGETKSTTHATTHGMMASDGTRKSMSADSAASSHGIEDLPTDSWVNVMSVSCRVSSEGSGSSPGYPYAGEPHNDTVTQKESVQRVWRGGVSEGCAERSTVISDDRVITPRPWHEGVSRKKRARNACVQMGEKLNQPSICGHIPVTRNSSSVVSENITITPRRRGAEHVSDQTELDVSTSDQFDDTLIGSDCVFQFSRPSFPKGELVRWWNSPGGLREGGDDTKERLHVSSGLHGDAHSYNNKGTKQRIMTNERVVASILGADVTRRSRRPGWIECKDSATITDDILSELQAEKMKNSAEILEISAGVTKRLPDTSADGSQAFQRHAGSSPMKSGSLFKQPDVNHRGDHRAQAGDGSWRNVFVSCAELTEASDERVLLEGAFHTSWCADRGDPFDGVTRGSRPAPAPLPFKLVLFARADGEVGTKVYGTFLRRLSQCDRSFKWKVKANIPCKI